MPDPTSNVGDPPSRPEDAFSGTPYMEVERLGSGGMGDVVLVEHLGLRKRFVAKLLHAELADHPQVLDRMRLEGQALGRLSHPNVVAVTGFERTTDGRPFLVMEYLRGRALGAELRERGPLPVLEAVTYTLQLLAALSAAHGIGIVHRDIKPDNLFLSQSPGEPVALKVLDFGIARVLPGAPANAPLPLSLPTTTGTVVGTPRFVSPEGAAGERVDERADLYAAGLMLYVMLAGRGPFDHVEGEKNLLLAHALETPRPPSAYARAPVPAELDGLVLRALAKDPDERFQSAEDFRERLDRVAALLVRPTGWLETTAFHGSSAAGVPAGAAVHPSATGRHQTETKRDKTPSTTRFSRRLLVLAFVAALVLTAFAVIALVVVVRGAG